MYCINELINKIDLTKIQINNIILYNNIIHFKTYLSRYTNRNV